MLIGKNYKIESDTLNVILSKRSVAQSGKNKGQELWTQIAYFSNIENALKHLADLEIHGTGLTDLKTVLKKQEELYKLIAETKKGE